MFVKRFYRLVLTIILFFSLSACLLSEKPLLRESNLHDPLPDLLVLVGKDFDLLGFRSYNKKEGEEEIDIRLVGFRDASGKFNMREDGPVDLRFEPIPNKQEHWIAEVAQSNGSYLYMILHIRDDIATFIIPNGVGKPEIIAGLDVDIRDGQPSVYFKDIDTLFRYASRVIERRDSERTEYFILDGNDPNAENKFNAIRANANALKEELKRSQQEEEDRLLEEQSQRRLELEKKQVANDGKFFGRWLYRLELDPITDKKKQYLYGFPNGYDNPQESPFIRISCNAASDRTPMEASFLWKQPLLNIYPDSAQKFARVTARFDSEEPIQMGWALSQDQLSTYSPKGNIDDLSHLRNGAAGLLAMAILDTTWTSQSLHKRLKRSDRAVFRGYLDSEGAEITLIFDTNGYAEAAQNFDAQCN